MRAGGYRESGSQRNGKMMKQLNEYYRKIRSNHDGMMNCKDLLRVNAEQGGEKMPHCNAMIRECIGYVEEILKEKGRL